MEPKQVSINNITHTLHYSPLIISIIIITGIMGIISYVFSIS